MAATQTRPIELHFWPTPNGFKVSIMLEELGVPYELKFVNIGRGDQFKPEFLKISPNNRMPAIVDPEGPSGRPVSVFESSAILMYLGRKFERFFPVGDEEKRIAVEEWLSWQMANVGPVFGQNNHFSRYAKDKLPYAISRFADETHRLYGVLDRRLEGRDFVCDDYSIADMAIFPWVRNPQRRDIAVDDFPNVKRWLDALEARPAVKKAVAITAPDSVDISTDEEARKILFNQRAR